MTFRTAPRLIQFLLAAIAFVATTTLADAQTRPSSSRYTPRRPTVSPYLNLTRPDSGALPNYYSLVKPQLEQKAINHQQQSAILNQQKSLEGLKSKVTQLDEPMVRATGSGGGFSNLSHYYPTAPGYPGRTSGRRR